MYKLFLVTAFIFYSVNYVNSQYNQNICGYSTNQKTYDGSDETKILGGKLSNPLDWPFVVSIMGQEGSCTGTIIGEKWILSATHCNENGTPMTVTVNDEKYESERIVINKWDVRTKNDDIMLVKLKNPLKFSRSVLPVCLFQNVTAKTGDIAAVIGYGERFEKVAETDFTKLKVLYPKYHLNFNDNKNLYETPLTIQDMSYCNVSSTEANLIKTRICAGGKMKGTTLGDSGGPLLVVRNNRWIQLGITSYGYYTPAENNDVTAIFDRGMYTRVSAYCNWIETNTLGEVKCQ